MRPARLKQIRKLVQRLTKNGFRPPYNILADHYFLSSFNSTQMSPKVLEHILNGPIKLYTTHCEYKKYKEAVKDRKLIGCVDVKKCTHKDFRTLECLAETIQPNNPNHYFVAVSPKYRHLKEDQNLPLIFLRAGVLCVEIGQKATEDLRQKELAPGLSDQEKAKLEALFQ
ncbi:U3 small nucleolar RNA-associated protein 23 [Nematocida homosporus]|uniref:U3 small nucleolar RNA-associated protein 23 n=1 Tax=Nematocida homosporus TaxID=1912981 RepID=UPI00222033A5|nr:U3 small nucleolar RNA-associated protein 23 [Nematocida homosporus]KAI5186016.1 U3 small nucleolar RNA-associated protein 23 [Nematocida homosporus]